jgi:hypothetical protein
MELAAGGLAFAQSAGPGSRSAAPTETARHAFRRTWSAGDEDLRFAAALVPSLTPASVTSRERIREDETSRYSL